MKIFTLLFHTLFSIALKSSATFPGLTNEQPLCFGREFNESHLESHPLQTIKLMKIKLQTPEEFASTSLIMSVQAQIKHSEKDPYTDETTTIIKPYDNVMLCTDGGEGKLECRMECDGGTAVVSYDANTRVPRTVRLINKGFAILGGCDDDTKDGDTIWLDPKTGGDDVFDLYALPAEFCQK